VEQISLQYPNWTILLCILGGLLYAGFLYYRSGKFTEKAKWLKPLLGFIRFTSVVLIGILLLGPMIKHLQEDSKQPSIALLLDNSQSITEVSNDGSTESLRSSISTLYSQLSASYKVDIYAIDQDIIQLDHPDSLTQEGQITNLSQGIDYISDVYEGENLGGVILVSDGIYNEGKNPIYSKFKSLSPIYTLALGDTSKQKDVVVKRILYNSVAYLNDQMLTEVDIQGFNSSGERVKLTVERESANGYQTIHTEQLTMKGVDAFETIDIELEMDQVGINHFRYRISPVSGEFNRNNNVKDIYIEILDARQKIGIIATAPHPDLSAIKQLLEQNKNFEIEIFFNLPSASAQSNLDLVIFHQLPSKTKNISGILTQLNAAKTPRMYVLGPSTDIELFNTTQDHVTILGSNGTSNLSQALISPTFVNFTLAESTRNQVLAFPPLVTPFGEYNLGAEVQTLLSQKIGKIETDFPLLSFADKGGIKTTFLFGTDIWRWKLFNFLQGNNFDTVSELLDKVVMYTSTKEDKRKFRVNTPQNIYNENEDISFIAELYNNNYELVNDPDIVITISNQDKEEYTYTFTKSDITYALNAGRLPTGRYTYRASTSFNGQAYEANGRFNIRAIQFELYDLQARHNVLYTLSERYNGKMFYPNQISDLGGELLSNESMKPIIYQSTITKPLLDSKWIFALLALLLAAEWLLRRYNGAI
jgi:hypothetical protein